MCSEASKNGERRPPPLDPLGSCKPNSPHRRAANQVNEIMAAEWHGRKQHQQQPNKPRLKDQNALSPHGGDDESHNSMERRKGDARADRAEP